MSYNKYLRRYCNSPRADEVLFSLESNLPLLHFKYKLGEIINSMTHILCYDYTVVDDIL